MGSTFGNLQVWVRDVADVARTRILTALREALSADGFVETDHDADADRSLLVSSDARWISIYDDANDPPEPGGLDALALRLSGVLEGAVLAIAVHDSDVLLLDSFDRGKKLASYDSNPKLRHKPKRGEPNAEAWQQFLAAGATVSELEAAFREEKLFADHTLVRIAELFGMDPARVQLGFRYALEEATEHHTSLHFKDSRRPRARENEGPPRFEAAAWQERIAGDVGSEFQTGFAVRNVGGKLRGVSIVTLGDVFEAGLLRANRVDLIIGKYEQGMPVPSAPFVAQKLEHGERIWVARFPELELPAGMPAPDMASTRTSIVKTMEAHYRSQLHANFHAEVVAPGAGQLRFGFVPDESPAAGQFGFSAPVTIHPAARRPLHAEGKGPFRELDARQVLFGLVSSDLPQAQAAAIATPLIERFWSAFPEDGKFSFRVFRADADARPKSGTARAQGFFKSARWRTFQSELATEARLELERQNSEKSTDGCAFGDSTVRSPSQDATDRACSSLCFWFSSIDRSDEVVALARERLIELMEEFFVNAHGLQGLLGKWGRRPQLDSTPYEYACGIHTQTLQRSWLTRFLRGVTDDWLWLAEPLLERIDLTELARVALIEPSGRGLRARVRPEFSLDDFEAVLAPVLASATDSRAADDRFYGR